jgi:copper chaperone CopZ
MEEYMKTLNIEVEGMNCGGCVNKISNHFQNVDGISDTKVNLEGQTVTIIADDGLSNMKVRNDLIELGFSVKSMKKA